VWRGFHVKKTELLFLLNSLEREAFLKVFSHYKKLKDYIYNDGRFFVGYKRKNGATFLKEIDKVLPYIKVAHREGEIYYRVRIIDCLTYDLNVRPEKFEYFQLKN